MWCRISTCFIFFERVGVAGASGILSAKLAEWKARFQGGRWSLSGGRDS